MGWKGGRGVARGVVEAIRDVDWGGWRLAGNLKKMERGGRIDGMGKGEFLLAMGWWRWWGGFGKRGAENVGGKGLGHRGNREDGERSGV